MFHNNNPKITLPITQHITFKGNAWLYNPHEGKFIPLQAKMKELSKRAKTVVSFANLCPRDENWKVR